MLKLEKLTVKYGDSTALHDVALTVAPGEIVALIGPNGTGKSTLIRAISGLIPIHDGTINYSEKNLLRMSPAERARILAVVPQARQLGGAFTVAQTVMMGRTAYMNWLGQPSKTDRRHVEQALINTRTDLLAERRIAELSGGEQQRVLLARAMAQNTPLLILDEPTNHLDLQHQSTILSLVRQQVSESGLAVLMALHDLNQVSQYADRVAMLVEGRLIASGTPEEVLTAERISAAYNTEIQVITHPDLENPIILPK
jgi:iron complex transport system ATP-binding protein